MFGAAQAVLMRSSNRQNLNEPNSTVQPINSTVLVIHELRFNLTVKTEHM